MTDPITDPTSADRGHPVHAGRRLLSPAGLDDRYLVETTWWSFNVPELRLGAWLHSQYHVNLGTCTWRVFAWDPSASDPDELAYYRLVEQAPMPADPDLRDITFPDGGFSVTMLEPLRSIASPTRTRAATSPSRSSTTASIRPTASRRANRR